MAVHLFVVGERLLPAVVAGTLCQRFESASTGTATECLYLLPNPIAEPDMGCTSGATAYCRSGTVAVMLPRAHMRAA